MIRDSTGVGFVHYDPPVSTDDTERVSEIYARLLAEGHVVDVGEFTTDHDAAAAKRARFRYEDRSAYLVPFAEAAALWGASGLSVRTAREDMVVQALGVEWVDVRSELPQLRALAGLGSKQGPTSRVAVAVDMAVGLDGLQDVYLEYRGPEVRIIGKFAPDGTLEVRELDPLRPAVEPVLMLSVDRRWTQALSLGRPMARELEQLTSALECSNMNYAIDGDSPREGVPSLRFSRRRVGEGYSLIAGFVEKGARSSALELEVAGVTVERRSLPGHLFLARVALSSPARDLSGMRIADRGQMAAIMADVELAREEATADLREARRLGRPDAHVDGIFDWAGVALGEQDVSGWAAAEKRPVFELLGFILASGPVLAVLGVIGAVGIGVTPSHPGGLVLGMLACLAQVFVISRAVGENMSSEGAGLGGDVALAVVGSVMGVLLVTIAGGLFLFPFFNP